MWSFYLNIVYYGYCNSSKYYQKVMQQKIRSIKSSKLFDAKKFAGKINWGEDALKYDKRVWCL